ncbi:hypothetical protein BJ322DRAFT_134543 [Thelephora terrestris]|uniref:Uncharacterized protein n=1 Tax=Thelephora terrestris TaxID=56493 RepID=A0A9P6HRQ0_9AGAM|nr:hypothetical protein BJ322DRAFT_134543 [Thelephora terrestris]
MINLDACGAHHWRTQFRRCLCHPFLGTLDFHFLRVAERVLRRRLTDATPTSLSVDGRMAVMDERAQRPLKWEALQMYSEVGHRAVPTHTPSRSSKRAERDTLDTRCGSKTFVAMSLCFLQHDFASYRTLVECGDSRSGHCVHFKVAIAGRRP